MVHLDARGLLARWDLMIRYVDYLFVTTAPACIACERDALPVIYSTLLDTNNSTGILRLVRCNYKQSFVILYPVIDLPPKQAEGFYFGS
jgi:hypothetical protein